MLETERKENGSLYNLARRLSSPVSAYAPQLEAQLKQLRILCLTARSNNKHMWERYANNGCGLVFEYATADLHSIDGDLQALSLPVMYSETNIPAMMVFALIESGAINRSHPTIQLFEQVLLLKAVYTKDPKEYAAEEEWRLCASSRPGENGMNYVTRCCVPRAVILGSNIDEAMRSKIIRTAKSKSIEIREGPERLL